MRETIQKVFDWLSNFYPERAMAFQNEYYRFRQNYPIMASLELALIEVGLSEEEVKQAMGV